jgi:hypothetical protein
MRRDSDLTLWWVSFALRALLPDSPFICLVEIFRACCCIAWCHDSLPEFSGPVRQQSDRRGFGVVGGLDDELFAVRADVVTDAGEVGKIELE